jgi:hypothetical protein
MADAEKDFFQKLSGELIDFFTWAGESLGDPLARDGIIRDLGGKPSNVPTPTPLPGDKLDAIKAFRDASHPDAEAAISALADLAVVLDAIAGQVEAWGDSFSSGAQDLGHALLELMASNYVRLRAPRLFLLMQGVSQLEDTTSTFGPGSNNLVNVWDSLMGLLGFLWQPGKSLEQYDPGTDRRPDLVASMMDFLARAAAVTLGALDRNNDIKIMQDVMTGWDGRGLDVDTTTAPFRSDVISERMTSFSFGGGTHNSSTETGASSNVNVTTAMIHAVEGGPALFLALGGNADIEDPLSRTWTFSFKARMDAAIALLIAFDRFQIRPLTGGGGNFEFSVGYSANPRLPTPDDPAPPQVAFSIPSSAGSRLDVGHLAFTLALTSDGAEFLTTITDAALLIETADHDSFTGEMLGKSPFRLPFNLIIGYSSSRGLVLEASRGASAKPAPLSGSGNVGPPIFAATIPIGTALGPVTVHEVSLRLSRGPADVPPAKMKQTTIEVDTSFSAQIGPVYIRMDQLGILFTVDSSKPPEERNLRLVDLHLGAKFPRGIAVNVETAVIAGGGSILHDPDQGIYFGTLDLAFRGGLTLQAICLVATKAPDGSKAFSFVAILTIEFGNPYPLGMGFFLKGLGGLVAMHRTFDEVAMRAALPTGQLRNVLFPTDPVHHTAEILRALQTLFPARRGSYMVGVLAKIGWASPTLVEFELGLIYEWGKQHRLIILGRVSAILPRADLAIISLNMDSVGIIDFDAGTFALDAMLYDSKICSRFVITGGMAMRMSWGDSVGFALAIGGMHPKFTPPAGFPSVARLQLALTNGDNPKLICQAYFAVTSNTVQFGASASLYAAAYGFSIQGEIGFDVLIQLLPFHFLADFRASVQLKRGSHNLFKVSVEGELEGPLPLRASGKATFEILWCDFSVKFNATLADGGTPNDVVLVDVLGLLITALSDAKSWQAQLPDGASQLVGLRQPVNAGVLLHPLGTLTVRQTVVPLGLTRDIDRVGTGTPSTDRRFTVTATAIGTKPQSKDSVRELFAPGQFFDMSDDDKLAAPSFEAMDAGVTFGNGGYTAGPGKTSPFEYTDILIGADGNPIPQPDPFRQDGPTVLVMTFMSPAGASRVRRTVEKRFASPVSVAAPTVNPGGWAAVAVGAPLPADAKLTWAEARGNALNRAGFVIVPRSELVGT